MLRALGPHGGDAGVQHVIDSRVAVEAPLHVVLAVRLVALLVAAVLQTVPLQVLECGAAGRDTAVTKWVGQADFCCPAVRPAVMSQQPPHTHQEQEGPLLSPAPCGRVGTAPPARRTGAGSSGGHPLFSTSAPRRVRSTQLALHPGGTASQAASAHGYGESGCCEYHGSWK